MQDLQTTLIASNDALVDLRAPASSHGRDGKSTKGSKELGKGDRNKSPKPSKKKRRAIASAEQGRTKEGEVKLGHRCFLCNGPHRAKDSPTKLKGKVTTMRDEEDSDSDGSVQTDTLQVVGALRVEQPKQGGLGLMYVPVVLYGRKVSALVDTGKTHSFVSTKVSDQLGLRLGANTSKIKVVNSPAKQIHGLARGVRICKASSRAKLILWFWRLMTLR